MSRMIRIPAPLRRDLNIIRKEVEKELEISIRNKDRKRKYTDAKKVFIALVFYIYNVMQKELNSADVVSLQRLAIYMKYKSHASISLYLVDTHKGNLTLLEYLKSKNTLWKCYNKVKERINVSKGLPFRKFIVDKKRELEQEIAIINRYLKITDDAKSKKKSKKSKD